MSKQRTTRCALCCESANYVDFESATSCLRRTDREQVAVLGRQRVAAAYEDCFDHRKGFEAGLPARIFADMAARLRLAHTRGERSTSATARAARPAMLRGIAAEIVF